jgi:hypothetical protein
VTLYCHFFSALSPWNSRKFGASCFGLHAGEIEREERERKGDIRCTWFYVYSSIALSDFGKVISGQVLYGL